MIDSLIHFFSHCFTKPKTGNIEKTNTEENKINQQQTHHHHHHHQILMIRTHTHTHTQKKTFKSNLERNIFITKKKISKNKR